MSSHTERALLEAMLDNAIMMAADVVVMVEDSDCEETEVDGAALVALLYTKFCKDHDYFMELVKIAKEGRKLVP